MLKMSPLLCSANFNSSDFRKASEILEIRRKPEMEKTMAKRKKMQRPSSFGEHLPVGVALEWRERHLVNPMAFLPFKTAFV